MRAVSRPAASHSLNFGECRKPGDPSGLQFHRNDSELPDPFEFLDNISEASREAGNHHADPRALPAYLIFFLSMTVVLVCVYYAWMAPILLADVAVDGSLVGWLYRPQF